MVSVYYIRRSSPSPAVSVFNETALGLGKKEIRLLTLQPGRRDEPIKCDLSVVRLDDDPPYEALSYTWGDAAVTASILLRGTSTKVTINLHGALLHLRNKSLPRNLWIDALCINQQDPAELGDQVQHMRLIYKKASQVLVWLGEASEDSDLAMDLVARIGTAEKDGESYLDYADDLPDNNTRRAALNALFRRPWWTRIWVLQEFAVADADPLVGCGDKWLSSVLLDNFAYNIQGLYDYNIEKLLERDPFEPLDNLLYFRSVAPLDLTRLLWMTRRTSKATRPHDQIYALVGLVDEGSVDAILTDYEKNVTQLFNEVAAFCLKTDRNLDFLYSAPERHNFELPSWVPDWTINQTRSSFFGDPVGHSNYDASEGSESSFMLSEDIRVLTVEGYEVDTIIDADYESSELRIWDVQEEASRIGRRLVDWARTHFVHDTPVDVRVSRPSNLLADVHDMLGHCQTVVPKYYDYDPRLRELIQIFLEDFDKQGFEYPPRGTRGRLLDDVDAELRNFVLGFDLPMFTTLLNRRLFVTRGGMIGLGTEALEIGDIVCILFGGTVPFVLRRVDHDEDGYILIGDAYVKDLMNVRFVGARPRPENLKRTWFRIV